MRKIALSLITLSLVFQAAQAKTYSNKTFLMPRDQITNLPMEYTTWHRKIHRRENAEYNGTVQVVGFYQESTNKADLGKYFGFNWHGKEGLEIENQIGVSETNEAGTKVYPKLLLNSLFIMHDFTNAYNNLNANYKFKPYQEVYGARFEWHQDLDKIFDGLFFRISTPLVDVRNHMNITKLIPDTKEEIPHDPESYFAHDKADFLDFLEGKLINPYPHDLQEQLKHAKISNTSHSATGFADVEVMLGYNAHKRNKSRCDVSISVIIPTGKTPTGDYIFEPIYGNGRHWGVGFGLDYNLTMWERENKSIEFMAAAKYKFLFEGNERRTLNFKLPYPGPQELSAANYYLLAGEIGNINKPLFPFANVLNRTFIVRPGSVIDAIAALAFNYGGFTFDIGYNIYFKEEERVHLKNHWENDKYAVADKSYDTSTEFELTYDKAADSLAYGGSAAVNGANVAIQGKNLDFNSVKTPFQVSNKIYAGMGYNWNKMKYPVLLGAGFSYEKADKNTALSDWALWLKAGMSW